MKNMYRHTTRFLIVIALFLVGTPLFLCLTPIPTTGTTSLYIDEDDNLDSVCIHYSQVSDHHHKWMLRLLLNVAGYSSHIRTGHYALHPSCNILSLVRQLRSGMQTPIRLTIQPVRTTHILAGELGRKLMLDSTALDQAFHDSTFCKAYTTDTSNVISLFLPTTYEVYWNISLPQLFHRMTMESKSFWNTERQEQARQIALTPNEVMTLASIVDEETANNDEKPHIAGMYINRLHAGMPLQADPTVKFAVRQFGLKRIYTHHTRTNNPYNTYLNIGLPPGPIRTPSIEGIEAVLHYTHHDYLYMCAKEDFSGTHNFARTYEEHLKNAHKYSKALNDKGIQ